MDKEKCDDMDLFEDEFDDDKYVSGRGVKRFKRENDQSESNGSKFRQSSTDMQFDVESNYSTTRQRKRLKGVKMLNEPLTLKCCWNDCNVIMSDYNLFINHVFTHIDQHEDEKGLYVCNWTKCSFKNSDFNLIQCHISYHTYYAKLQCIGTNVKERLNLPDCLLDEVNTVPECKMPFMCDWVDCRLIFNRLQAFLNHVQCHVIGKPKFVKIGTKNMLACCWTGCKVTCTKVFYLTEHMRSHTHEKLVACPKCGKSFATKTKFHDHCKRQESTNGEGYQCSQCLKIFQSERLLRNHVRLHVNNYKCHLCDMTCTTPASIARHIRYRHLEERPFKCKFCDHTTVTKNDLASHTTVHCSEMLYECEECSFKCRSMYGLEIHIDKVHHDYCLGDRMLYACHCCPKKYSRGSYLTLHLIRCHDFQWPSGHSRFRYKQDPEDGLCRLQTIRYESIEVTEEMIGQSQPSPNSQSHYNLRERKGRDNRSFMVVVSDKNEDNDSDFENTILQVDNNIVITIDEVDAEGNIIKSEVMDSKNIAVMSNKR